MRHKTLAMTERYAHVGHNTLQDAVRKLQEHKQQADIANLENAEL
jgi:hypothetical protein